MPRIKLSEYGNSPFEKLIGHNDKILDKWNELEIILFQTTSISFISASQKLGRIYNLTEEYQENSVTTIADLNIKVKNKKLLTKINLQDY